MIKAMKIFQLVFLLCLHLSLVSGKQRNIDSAYPDYNYDYADDAQSLRFKDLGNSESDTLSKRAPSLAMEEYNNNKFNYPFSSQNKITVRDARENAQDYVAKGSNPQNDYYLPDEAEEDLNVGKSLLPVRRESILPANYFQNQGYFQTFDQPKPYPMQIRSNPPYRNDGYIKNSPYYADGSLGYNEVNRQFGNPSYKNANYLPPNVPVDYDLAQKNLALFPPENSFDSKPAYYFTNPFFGSKSFSNNPNMSGNRIPYPRDGKEIPGISRKGGMTAKPIESTTSQNVIARNASKEDLSGLINEISGTVEHMINHTKEVLEHPSQSNDNSQAGNCTPSPSGVIRNNGSKPNINVSPSRKRLSDRQAAYNSTVEPIESVTTTGNKMVRENKEKLESEKESLSKREYSERWNPRFPYWQYPRRGLQLQQVSGMARYREAQRDKFLPFQRPGMPFRNDPMDDEEDYSFDEIPRHSIVRKHLENKLVDSPESVEDEESSKELEDSAEMNKQRKQSRSSINSSIEQKVTKQTEDIKTKKTVITDDEAEKADIEEKEDPRVLDKGQFVGKTNINEDNDKILRSDALGEKKPQLFYLEELAANENLNNPKKTLNIDQTMAIHSEDESSKIGDAEFDNQRENEETETNEADLSLGMSDVSQDGAQGHQIDEKVFQSEVATKSEKEDADLEDYEEAEKYIEDEVRNRLQLERNSSADVKESNSDYVGKSGEASDTESSSDMYEQRDGYNEGESNQSVDDSEQENSIENENTNGELPSSKLPSNAESESDDESEKQESPRLNGDREVKKVEKLVKNTNTVIKNRKNMINQTSRLLSEQKTNIHNNKKVFVEDYIKVNQESKIPSTNDNNNEKNPMDDALYFTALKTSTGDKGSKETGKFFDPLASRRSLEPSDDGLTSESKLEVQRDASPDKSRHWREEDDDDNEDDDEEYDDDEYEEGEDDDYGEVRNYGKGKPGSDSASKSKSKGSSSDKKTSAIVPFRKSRLQTKSTYEKTRATENQSNKAEDGSKVELDVENDHNDKSVRSFNAELKNKISENPEKQFEKDREMRGNKADEIDELKKTFKTFSSETGKLGKNKLKHQEDNLDLNAINSDVEKTYEDSKKYSNQDASWASRGNPGRTGHQLNKIKEVQHEERERDMSESRKALLQKLAEYKRALAEKQASDDTGKTSSKSSDSSVKEAYQKSKQLHGKGIEKTINEKDTNVNGLEKQPRNFKNNYKVEFKFPSFKKSAAQNLPIEDQKNMIDQSEELQRLPQNGNKNEITEEDESESNEAQGLKQLNIRKEPPQLQNQENTVQNSNSNEPSRKLSVLGARKEYPTTLTRKIPRYKESPRKSDESLEKVMDNLPNKENSKETSKRGLSFAKLKDRNYLEEREVEEDDSQMDNVDEYDTENQEPNMEEAEHSKRQLNLKSKKRSKPKAPTILNPAMIQNNFGTKQFQKEGMDFTDENEDSSFENQKNRHSLGESKTSVRQKEKEDTLFGTNSRTPFLHGGSKTSRARKRQSNRKLKRRRDYSIDGKESMVKSLSDTLMEPPVTFLVKAPETESNVLDVDSGNVFYMTAQPILNQDEKVDDFVNFKE